MFNHHIINYILIDRASLIILSPPSINDLQSTLFNILFNLFLNLFCLPLIPHRKKLHLGICKLSLWFNAHLLNHTIEYKLHCYMLIPLIVPYKKFIYCLQPPNIIMGVWNHVNIKHLVLVFSIFLRHF